MRTPTIESLRAALDHAQAVLQKAERERDNWEPDIDNSDHTADLDASLDEMYQLPGALSHLSYSDLLREHDDSAYREAFNDWEDSIRGERERRRAWSDFDDLCKEVEDAEDDVEEAQDAVDEAEEAISTHPRSEGDDTAT